MFERIKAHNQNLTIKKATSINFAGYGNVLYDAEFQTLIQALSKKQIPETGNQYIADDPSMDFSDITDFISRKYYSEMPIQIGHCNGHTHALNAFEYHQGNEINFMATDCILMLANQRDIIDSRISASKAELFYFPAGTVIELYGTSLHFAPCALNQEGFRVGVILPKGTNQPLEKAPLSPLIRGKNKWLIAHPDSPAAQNGAFAGIQGENIILNLVD